jgi:hypothetical protein
MMKFLSRDETGSKDGKTATRAKLFFIIKRDRRERAKKLQDDENDLAFESEEHVARELPFDGA